MNPKRCKNCQKLFYAKGNQRYCENCVAEKIEISKERQKRYLKRYQIENRDILKLKKRNYYLKNKEYVKERSLRYYYENQEDEIKKRNEYRKSHKLYFKNYGKAYREVNKGKIKLQRRKWEKENAEYLKKYHQEYYQKHQEYLINQNKRYYQENLEEKKAYARNYASLNKEVFLLRAKEDYKKNRTKKLAQAKDYGKNHRKQINERARLRRKNDIKFRLDERMGGAIYEALKKRKMGRRWKDLVEFNIEDLVIHLETQFKPWMNWDNYGNRKDRRTWWIDHIKPISLFDYSSPEDLEFKECWALKNLQPLEKIANLRKSNHYD